VRLARAVAFLGALACAQPALAENEPPSPLNEVDLDLLRVATKYETLEAFVAELLQPIRKARAPGRLTRAEVEERKAGYTAKYRAEMVREVLSMDLDGDGAVSREELQQAVDSKGGPRARDLMLFNYDADKSGRVDLAEIVELARVEYARAIKGTDPAMLLLKLDANGDGATTVGEAESRARAVFARYDSDADGILDRSSRATINTLIRYDEMVESAKVDAARCGMPVASPQAQVVLFQSNDLQAISDVAISGVDEATFTGDVTVEPGNGKIFLVLRGSPNVVWRFSGAVERLERVVLIERRVPPTLRSAAVVGVDRSLVSWAPEERCLQGDGARVLANVHGRPLSAQRSVYTVASVSVPSLVTVGDRRGFSPRPVSCVKGSPDSESATGDCFWAQMEMERMFPGGVVHLDSKQVVAREPAVAYEVLPSPAGYVDAMQSGILSVVRKDGKTRYRIEKPLARFPPYGGGRGGYAIFQLAAGVSMPKGNADAFCILDDKGNILVDGNDCFGLE
jgi:Ca2+-binding EF-hand superfamily protein